MEAFARHIRTFHFFTWGRNAYLLQPLFWRLYVVAVLETLKPDSTLNVENLIDYMFLQIWK